MHNFKFPISVNKIEKSGVFEESFEILKDLLFGVRKVNITNETRSISENIKYKHLSGNRYSSQLRSAATVLLLSRACQLNNVFKFV